MVVLFITDNYPGGYTGAAYSLSYLIGYNDRMRLLFDTGRSSFFVIFF
jgi:metal-dependent hydrolase (beta-lactamase superfamily II)